MRPIDGLVAATKGIRACLKQQAGQTDKRETTTIIVTCNRALLGFIKSPCQGLQLDSVNNITYLS